MIANVNSMNDERRKPGFSFWVTVTVIVALVAYPLSIGPATWLEAHGIREQIPKVIDDAVFHFYAPLRWVLENSPEPVERAIRWCVSFWS